MSGFIPPVAFMEFQLNGILPIASEMRTIDHIEYTPAPDIIHEAVGHIPFLTHPLFSQFLKTYAQIVKKAIFSSEDIKQYELIRRLSDLKENSKTTVLQIKQCERELIKNSKNLSHISESAYLSRLIWWTSEYGLMGNIKNPKIYGAGLISSFAEATLAMSDKVKKIPLTKDCINYSYDITTFQPQLFVVPHFEKLFEVLESINQDLAWNTGGLQGVLKAKKSQTVNTVVLDSGLQISGILDNYKSHSYLEFLKFIKPCQLSFKNKELKHHGKNYHSEGYSTPVGKLVNLKKSLSDCSDAELKKINIKKGFVCELKFTSGIILKGEVVHWIRKQNKLLVITFKNCLVKKRNEVLFSPSWGLFDLGVGDFVTSVFSGLSDEEPYQKTKKPKFIVKKINKKKEFSLKEKKKFDFYKKIKNLNKIKNKKEKKLQLEKLTKQLLDNKKENYGLPVLRFYYIVKNSLKLKNNI